MMYSIEKGDPQQSSDRVSENDFLFSSDQPSRPVPCGIVKMVQSLSNRMMLFSHNRLGYQESLRGAVRFARNLVTLNSHCSQISEHRLQEAGGWFDAFCLRGSTLEG